MGYLWVLVLAPPILAEEPAWPVHSILNTRFLGGLGPASRAELGRAYYRAQQQRRLERNPYARYQRTDPTQAGRCPVGPQPRFCWQGVEASQSDLFTQRTRCTYPRRVTPAHAHAQDHPLLEASQTSFVAR